MGERKSHEYSGLVAGFGIVGMHLLVSRIEVKVGMPCRFFLSFVSRPMMRL